MKGEILQGAAAEMTAGRTGVGSTRYPALGSTEALTPGVPPVKQIIHPSATSSGTPTPSPQERCGIARSLLGHRVPSEHLCRLVTAAVQGATWDEIYALDAAERSAK